MVELTKRVLVLCALPYVNNIPHIGNIVGSHLPADIFARFCRLKGYETVFIGGSDENGTPSEVTAQKLGITPKQLCDKLYKIHKKIYDWFWISYDNFSRTSKPIHHKTTQEFFLKIYENGFISEGTLVMPYCPRCKRFLPDRYVEGTCPYCGYEKARGDQCEKCGRLLDPDQLINPRCAICGTTPIFKETKHLFLNLDKLSDKLEEWIKSNKHWKEHVVSLALGWIKEGLKPRCITRDLKWGVKVPIEGYEDKVFYVWFDAPIGYISSTKEWAEKIGKPDEWKKFWKDKGALIYNFLGKDNIPFHTIFWPGMLLAHGEFNLPYQVVGLNYCNYEGGKISKSKGWGIFCDKIIEADVDVDIWRYYFTWLIPETKDTEFKWKEFVERINNELVANLGNFIYRTLSFIWKYYDGKVPEPKEYDERDKEFEEFIKNSPEKVERLLEDVRLRDGLAEIINIAIEGNKYFQEKEPWKDKEKARTAIFLSVNLCKTLAILMWPYLPKSAENLWKMLNIDEKIEWKNAGKITIMPKHKINESKILFKKLTDEDVERLKKLVTKPTPLEEIFGGENVISFDEWKKVDIRVGKVLKVEDMPQTKKLYKLQVDFGELGVKQAVSGLKGYYKPEELEGKQFVFLVNLEPKKFFGETAEVMILAAVKDDKVVLIKPEREIENGARIE
ncbi:MAG: methionine--tRNA ligase [Candidatus Aenigmarchaeota archaeon]|nr:methionine--tRNA ligase [Candidatus Aenigmarchaeota archaeon]